MKIIAQYLELKKDGVYNVFALELEKNSIRFIENNASMVGWI